MAVRVAGRYALLALFILAVGGSFAFEEGSEVRKIPSGPRLFRVILPVADIERAAQYYMHLLGVEGRRVSPGRHYFDCGEVILAVFDPRADGDAWDATPNPDHIYFAVSDLEAVHKRALKLGGQSVDEKIETRPWGERSFYMRDPFGNPLCFVDEKTVFTGRSE